MSYSGYHKLKVLVVDDFESFRQTVSTMLQNFGVEDIDMADSGNAAMRWCEEKVFDIVLADYNLGRGRNGQQVLEELRYKKILKRKTLFILISAESSRSIIMSAYDYEPDAYLAKPITGKALMQRLDRLLLQRDQMLPIYQAIDDDRIADAVEMLNQRIIAGARNTTLCQKLLGELYLKISDLEHAESVYRKALEVRSIDWAKVGMARVKMIEGDHEKAKRWLTDIIKKNPFCLSAYDVLAEIHQLENDGEALEQVLKKVVEYCPMAILRQERLAYAAQANNDNQTAAVAFRQTVRLGNNSCYNKRENHINFGRTTANLLKETGSNANDLSREAIKALEELGNVFAQTEEEQIQVLLVESQVLAGQGNTNKAHEVIGRAQKRLNNLDQGVEVDTELDMVRALKTTGQIDAGDKLLESMVHRYRDDQVALEKIDELLEEPISDKNRGKVSSINKEGIAHYESADYQAAIDCFKKAKKTFPNHIGIRLNLVQALEGEMNEFGLDRDLMKQVEKILKSVKNQISASHQQYERYLQLSDMLNELKEREKQSL